MLLYSQYLDPLCQVTHQQPYCCYFFLCFIHIELLLIHIIYFFFFCYRNWCWFCCRRWRSCCCQCFCQWRFSYGGHCSFSLHRDTICYSLSSSLTASIRQIIEIRLFVTTHIIFLTKPHYFFEMQSV